MAANKTVYFLTSIALILAVCLFSQSFWPALFSYQDPIDPTAIIDSSSVLGVSSSTLPVDPDKRIEVDLTNQRLYGFDHDQKIFDFIISSGKWNRTPTGEFTIWAKVRSQKMSGGSKELGTYYYLPNVPYILFFYNDQVAKKIGYSLHGTYWHDNFGVPMSHGCINMKTTDVAQIYEWAQVGTKITIYGRYQSKSLSLDRR